MALNDRFAEFHAKTATADNNLQRSPIRNQASSVNRKLVQELANRPSVIEALRENIPGRFGRKQERVYGSVKSRLGFRNKQRKLPVHDRLGYFKERRMFHRRYSRSGVSPLMRDQLELQEPDFHRRHSRSGVSPLIRDQLELQEPEFEKECQLNQRENFCTKNFEEKWQSSSDEIYVEVNINESEPKIDMDDTHFKVECNPNQPRAYPTGIFNFYDGIRYYGSEIFIWITESDPIDKF